MSSYQPREVSKALCLEIPSPDTSNAPFTIPVHIHGRHRRVRGGMETDLVSAEHDMCYNIMDSKKSRELSQAGSVEEFRTNRLRHLNALAKRERRNPRTLVQGMRLQICLELFKQTSKEAPTSGVSDAQPGDLKGSSVDTVA
ncbi:hypothetical protein PHMEG_0009165 [Phytophthora megakarya]|uniref:Uncharacterized protein n=1 Tax=Phytophthora megakarya TaxID=4795 RepID=A0A225WGV9_9STRA|nr:hypothetical protein PHMEG_0009165 [Phytophthora megakarya]